MSTKERDCKAYLLAKEYLLNLGYRGVTSELIEEYINYNQEIFRPKTTNQIYGHLIGAAQNANMKAGVIKGGIGDPVKLSIVLNDFDSHYVLKVYGTNSEKLLDEIINRLKPKGKMRRTPNSIWPQFCKSILSGAMFISRFQTAEDFYKWVDTYDKDDRKRAELPRLLSKEVHGIGFALACDFLKGIGYINYGKPDVHIREIFEGLELCSPDARDDEVFAALVRVARNAGVDPYNADKLFWLIGSGYFYDHPNIGSNGHIGSHKKEFIEYACRKLGASVKEVRSQTHFAPKQVKPYDTNRVEKEEIYIRSAVYNFIPSFCPHCGKQILQDNSLRNSFQTNRAWLCPGCGLRHTLAPDFHQ